MSTYMIFNAASAIQYTDVVKGDFRFKAVIPTLPAAGQIRRLGLFTVNKGSGLYFEVTGTTFRAVAKDGVTGASSTTTITFETEWAGVPIDYRIIWEPGIAHFYIGGSRKATIGFPMDVILASAPMSLYINNEVSDNLLVGYVEAVGVQSYQTYI